MGNPGGSDVQTGAGPDHAALVTGVAAVIFDLDGVLVDTEPWWHEVRVAFAADRGRSWSPDDSRACMGRNSREWSSIMRERLGLADPAEAIERAIVDALVARYAAESVPIVAGRAGRSTTDRRPPPGRHRLIGAPGRDPGGARGRRPAGALRCGRLLRRRRGRQAGAGRLSEAARRLGVAPARCLVDRGFAQRRPGGARGRDARRPRPERERAARAGRGGRGRRDPRAARGTACRRTRRVRMSTPGAGTVPTGTAPATRAPRMAPRASIPSVRLPQPPTGHGPGASGTGSSTRSCGWPCGSTCGSGSKGLEQLPDGPAMLCFNHQSWADPFVVVAALPARPDIMFFGPREADMGVGRKNRLIRWTQRDVPFRPDKRGLVDVARRVEAILRARRPPRDRPRGSDPRGGAGRSCRSTRVSPSSRSGPACRSSRSGSAG